MVAVDANEKMLMHARRRNGDRASTHCANLEEPLPFLADASFDGVLCALAITYVRDHTTLFAEIRRILRRGGWFVFSTEHPFFSFGYLKLQSYLETAEVSCVWKGFGEPVTMPSYHDSLGAIAESLSANSFVIERILEPCPTEAFRAADPQEYEKLCRVPLFICIRATRAA